MATDIILRSVKASALTHAEMDQNFESLAEMKERIPNLPDPKKALKYRKKSLSHYHQHVSDLTISSTSEVDYGAGIFRQVYEKYLKEN